MINLTDHPIVLVEGEELDRRIRRALSHLYEAVDEKYAVRAWQANRKRKKDTLSKHGDKAFGIYFDPDKLPSAPYCAKFVKELATVARLGPRNEGMSKSYKALLPFLARKRLPPAHVAIKLKGFIKLALLALWREKAILLPFSFVLGGSALKEQASIIAEFESEVAGFFRKYKDGIEHRPASAAQLPASGRDRLYVYGSRIIWTTDYHRFEDVKIAEIGAFHQALLQSRRGGRESLIGRSGPPIALFLREMLTCNPDRMTYDAADVDTYALWALTPSYKEFSFSDFLRDRLEITEKVAAQKAEARKATQHKWGVRQQPRRRESSQEQEEVDSKINSRLNDLALMAAKQDHNAVVQYFSQLRGVARNGLDWLKRGAPYPGREHVNLPQLSELWLESWLAFIQYRKAIRGYDSNNGPTSAFNLLCDYLFLYLPWWKELFPDTGIDLPLAPKHLKRRLFIHRTQLDNGEPIPVERMPLTFLDLLPRRQPGADSRYGTLQILIQFFEWLETGFEDEERIAGSAFRSPIRRIDLPRVSSKKKTNKIPFSKRVYPHLLFYGYGVEAFGEYLQHVALERPDAFVGKRLRQQRFMPTGPSPEQVDNSGRVSEEFLNHWPANFGYTPFVRYRGKTYPIRRVPNVYPWAARDIDLGRFSDSLAGVDRRWVPHLTTLRLLIGAVETGLRLQSLQWLDLRTWDKLNRRQGVPPGYTFNMTNDQLGRFASPMTVSTDKTKDESWDVLTVFRVRSCFYREQYFRDSIREANMDELVDYEAIENGRFGKILPLFRSHCAPGPISDSTYDRHWRMLMWGFEEHFNFNVAAADAFVPFVYLAGTDEDRVPDYNETNVRQINVINTPHACRATYATNRTGILEASDVAQQLGHSDTVVTAHYTISTPEIMEEKLAAVEREIQSSYDKIDSSSPAYVRADSQNGALYKRFQDNRDEAMGAFRFAPAVSLWSTEDLNTGGIDGLHMLKSSPMSQIRFRETHICPVGEACPSDVVEKIGEPRRCGLCPLAMRCVDHLTAIAAKINQLKMRVRTDIRRAERLTEKGEPAATVDALYDAAEFDANEIVGWQLSHDILLQMLESRRAGGEQKEYHVEAPEIVQRHLQAVVTNRSVSEFLLQRIADANAFPTLADPEIQRVADRFCRYLLVGDYHPKLDDDPVTLLAGLVKTHLKPMGLTISELAKRIDQLESLHAEARPVLLDSSVSLLYTEQEAA
jgi:hypothetical protein